MHLGVVRIGRQHQPEVLDRFVRPALSDQGHCQVARVGRHAVVARAQDGVHAVEPAGCVATRARDAFVAASRLVIKVVASGTLHQVAARRRHISDLARRAE